MKIKLILIISFLSVLAFASNKNNDDTKDLQSLYYYFDWEINLFCSGPNFKNSHICKSVKADNKIIHSLVEFLSTSQSSNTISNGPQLTQRNCHNEKIIPEKKPSKDFKCRGIFVEEDKDSLYMCKNQKFKKFTTTRDKIHPCLKELINKDKTWFDKAKVAFEVPDPLVFFKTLPGNKPFHFYATRKKSDKYLIQIAQICGNN